MNKTFFFKKKIIFSFLFIIFFSYIFFIHGQSMLLAMSSTNYGINSDSINSGGLDVSTSENYDLKDTVGEVATGESTSETYKIRAGYRQLQEIYISISSESDEALSSVSGLSGGTGVGSSTWTVITDNPAGYEMNIRSTTSPALQSGPYSFDDYSPSGVDPDYNFTISTTESAFGFSPEGQDIVQRFKDNGSVCNAGSSDGSMKCWDGFSTTTQTISRSYSPNQPSGTATTIQYSAGIGSSKIQENGDYSTEIIVTAIAL